MRFTIDIATPHGACEPAARLDIGGQLPGQKADALRFNPAKTGRGIMPIGVLQAVRRLSYAASQAGRSAIRDPSDLANVVVRIRWSDISRRG